MNEQTIMAAVAQCMAQVAGLRALMDEPKDLAVETAPAFVHPGVVATWAGAAGREPAGWLACDGASYSSTLYPGLFAAIGYTYGGSAGSFKVPDLKGRRIAGYNSGVGAYDTVGKTGGSDAEHSHSVSVGDHADHKHDLGNHTHVVPDHSHLLSINRDEAGLGGNDKVTDVSCDPAGELTTGYPSSNTSGWASETLDHEVSESAADHRDPFMAMVWIIKA